MESELSRDARKHFTTHELRARLGEKPLRARFVAIKQELCDDKAQDAVADELERLVALGDPLVLFHRTLVLESFLVDAQIVDACTKKGLDLGVCDWDHCPY